METGDRAAGDGNKQEREQVARPDRPGTINKFGQRWHSQRRTHDQNPDRQTDNRTNFQEGREVITRREQQPDRQYRRDKTITHQHPGKLHASKIKVRRPGWACRHPSAGNNSENKKYQPNDRHLADAPRTQITQVDAHKNRQWNSERDSVRSPRAMGQRFHHDHRQDGQNDHHDHKAGHQRDHPCRRAHLLFNQLAKRTPITPGRDEQHHKVLHRSRQHNARQQPDHPRQIAHLRRQYRPDQRTCASNGRKMVTEQHFFIGRDIIQTIIMTYRGRHTRWVNRQHFFGDIEPIKTIRNKIDTDRRHHDP